jgi:cytochrome P450
MVAAMQGKEVPVISTRQALRLLRNMPGGLAHELVKIGRETGLTFRAHTFVICGDPRDAAILASKQYVHKFGKMLEDMLGLYSLLTAPGDTWLENRKRMSELVRSTHFGYYTSTTTRVATDILGQLPEGEYNIIPIIKELTLTNMSRMMFPDLESQDLQKLLGSLPSLMKGLDFLMPRFMLGKFGWIAYLLYFRAMVGLYWNRRIVDKVINKYIAKRAGGESFGAVDAISMMLKRGMPASHVLDNTKALYVGGSDTTYAEVASGMLMLAQDQQLQEDIYAEVIAANGNYTLDTLPKLGELRAVIQTYAGPALFNARSPIEDTVLPSGFKVKKGQTLIVMPSLYPWAVLQPDAEPFRLDIGFHDKYVEEETKKGAAFGGGQHRCLGIPIEELELPIFFAELVKRVRLHMPANKKDWQVGPSYEGVLCIPNMRLRVESR